MLEERALGTTGLTVSILGLGCGAIGDESVSERDVEALVLHAIDRGVRLFDTARSYGDSEERLGRALRLRPHRAIVSTKVGYGVEGHRDWTGPCIAAGIDRALRTLALERIDVVHLHSCPQQVLADEAILRALEDAVRAGKIAVAAYSGENDDLDAAVRTGVFRSVQLSVSPWDQRSLRELVPSLAAEGIGVIAKRAIANAPWRFEERPSAGDLATYWDRYQALSIDHGELALAELALRFTAHAPHVCSALVGTRSIAHLDAAIDAAARGPLDAGLLAHIASRFEAIGAEWPGVI
jgi:aryl-alcohol dehydrogenase-like predicted oxidoreductase